MKAGKEQPSIRDKMVKISHRRVQSQETSQRDDQDLGAHRRSGQVHEASQRDDHEASQEGE